MKAGVLGASGYAGGELLRLAAGHRELEVTVAAAGSAAGRALGAHTPSLAAAYPDLALMGVGAALQALEGLDVVFCALPHGESQTLLPRLEGFGGVVVDLAADFRLVDPDAYPLWYGEEHRARELLGCFVYGLPELHRAELRGARRIAAPGCYPTAAALALVPLVRAGLLDPGPGFIVDAASGVSGAGRTPSERLHFGEVEASFTAYGLVDHRHTPEMEQEIGAQVLFTPHLAPMSRGILATCYGRPGRALGADDPLSVLAEAYREEPFVQVVDDPPATKTVTGSNSALVTARFDPRTGWVVALCALDNLVKGAAGQALQAMNVALGLPEATGLPRAGLYP